MRRAAKAPDAIRAQFFKLTTFNIKKRVFDLGNTNIADSLEETHDNQIAVVKQVLQDGKRLIILGGGNDISYADGRAMSEVYGPEWWIGINIDSHLDVRVDQPRNSGTPYRQLLEEKLLLPDYFFEVGFQSHFCSPVYYNYIRDLGVHRISLELLRSRAEADLELKETIKLKFINQSAHRSILFLASIWMPLNVRRSRNLCSVTAWIKGKRIYSARKICSVAREHEDR